jgi:hypothetical protein
MGRGDTEGILTRVAAEHRSGTTMVFPARTRIVALMAASPSAKR